MRLKTFGEKVKKLRKELGLTQLELANKINYSDRSMITKIEKGLVDLPLEKINLIIKALNTTPGYLMDLPENKPKGNVTIINQELISIPIYESISAGYGSVIDDSYIEPTDIDYLPMPNFPNWQNCFAIKVSGDSMEPTIPNGAIVLINTELSIDNNKIGAFAIGDDSFLKRKKILNNSILLISDNKEYEPILVNENDNFKEIGKVIKVIIDFSSL